MEPSVRHDDITYEAWNFFWQYAHVASLPFNSSLLPPHGPTPRGLSLVKHSGHNATLDTCQNNVLLLVAFVLSFVNR